MNSAAYKRFSAYYEDVHLACRARRAGWRCVYVPDSIVYQEFSGTSRQGSSLKAFLLSRNRVWLMLRNASARQLLYSLPTSLAYDIGVIAVTGIRQQSLAPLQGKIAALTCIRGLLKDRHVTPFLPLDAFAPSQGLLVILRERRQRDRIAAGAKYGR